MCLWVLGAKAEEVAPPILFPFSDLIVGRGMKTPWGGVLHTECQCEESGGGKTDNHVAIIAVPHYLYTTVWCHANHRMNLHLYTVPGFHTPPYVHFRELVQKSLVFTLFWILRVTLGFSSTINRIGRI